MELQRSFIWVIFVFSLAVLWDRWEVAHGGRAMFLPMFTTSPADNVAAVPAPGAARTGNGVAPVPTDAVSTGPALPGAAAPTANSSAPAELVHVETDLLRVDFDPRGAVLVRAELLKEDTSADWTAEGLAGFVTRTPQRPKEHIVLFDRSAGREYLAQSGLYIGGAKGPELPNHVDTVFTVLPGARSLGGGQDELAVGFEAQSGGVSLRKTFVFHRGRYDIDVRHEVRNTGSEPVSPLLYLQITRDNGGTEGESRFYKTYTGPAIYSEADHYQKIPFDDIAKSKAFQPKAADDGWLAMVQHYFLSAWIPAAGVHRDYFTSGISDKLFVVGAKIPLGSLASGAGTTQQAVLYMGPQDQVRLEALSPGLDRVADYGWLDPIAKPLFWLLGWLHKLIGNWGWSIVALTILVKLALYPLAAAGFKSMARMKEVAPRLQALKEQYGEDKQRLQAAMMELYKKEKINPAGGCLPIVVQIPVFIALYWVLLGSVEMRNSPWILWIHDLASPDPWFVLPAVMMATSWWQVKLQPTPPDPVQAKMMMFMPLVFGVMFFFFPSGLVLYYVLNNGLSMLQQWRINHTIGKGKNKKKGG